MFFEDWTDKQKRQWSSQISPVAAQLRRLLEECGGHDYDVTVAGPLSFSLTCKTCGTRGCVDRETLEKSGWKVEIKVTREPSVDE